MEVRVVQYCSHTDMVADMKVSCRVKTDAVYIHATELTRVIPYFFRIVYFEVNLNSYASRTFARGRLTVNQRVLGSVFERSCV